MKRNRKIKAIILGTLVLVSFNFTLEVFSFWGIGKVESLNFDKPVKRAEKIKPQTKRIEIYENGVKNLLTEEEGKKFLEKIAKLKTREESHKVELLKEKLKEQKEEFKVYAQNRKQEKNENEEEKTKKQKKFRVELKERYDLLKELNDQQKEDFDLAEFPIIGI